MDHIVKLAACAGILWVWLAIVFSEYDHPWLSKATRDWGVRLSGALIIVWLAVWWTFGDTRTKQPAAQTLPAKQQTAISDPESKENKYVRIRRVTPPEEQFEDAILLEFGVTRLDSQGLAVMVPFGGDQCYDWFGEPNRTDHQKGGFFRSGGRTVEDGVVKVYYSNLNLTAHQSYYLCILSRSKTLREPANILYFAVVQNRELLSPKLEAVGSQYTRMD